MKILDQVYSLRRDFVIIGLTGKTGSGCTTVANQLKTQDFKKWRTNHLHRNNCEISNESRKDEIVYNFLSSGKNWIPFEKITASDVIFLFAFQLSFEEFVNALSEIHPEHKNRIQDELEKLKTDYDYINQFAKTSFNFLEEKGYRDDSKSKEAQDCWDFISQKIPVFRDKLKSSLNKINEGLLSPVLQAWGNNVRKYNSIKVGKTDHENSPACLARMINKIAKTIRCINKKNPTRVVIDALRNPFEILYFKERFSAYYTISVNTDRKIRHQNLIKRNLTNAQIEDLDKQEGEKSGFKESYALIDINRCIEMSDIIITHDGTNVEENRNLQNQLARYVALILHPGLIPPTPLERCMQIAYTAKLNSGCLSRQVGAAITDESYSLKAIGWNTVPEGQTPCSLRNLKYLVGKEDVNAYSNFELGNEKFSKYTRSLYNAYPKKDGLIDNLQGLCLAYCFKDIYTSVANQKGNQVHTRSLHAEENAFLQLAKYGSMGIQGGKLFTTASCCELCGKKAYQLGIRQIYYIDTYPGITNDHILQCGVKRPEMILFHGAIGKAYISLYEPFLPLKDEIKERTGINPKSRVDFERSIEDKGPECDALSITLYQGPGKPSNSEFISRFKEDVRSGKIDTWVIDEGDDFTTKRDDWRMKGWYKLLEIADGVLFKFVPSTKEDATKELHGIFIGRMVATLYANYSQDIKKINILFREDSKESEA